MAGGVGSRFWPASRESRPKQFLDILGTGQSLIQSTYERFTKLTPPDHILVVTNEAYRELVQQHLPNLPAENILCEPSRNNTAPSVAYTALHVEARDPGASLVIAPSDHVILKEDAFLQAIPTGLGFAERQHGLVTLGIEPTRPDTGYGYIQYAEASTEGRCPQGESLSREARPQHRRGLCRGRRLRLERWDFHLARCRHSGCLPNPQPADLQHALCPTSLLRDRTRSERSLEKPTPRPRRSASTTPSWSAPTTSTPSRATSAGSDLGTWGSLHAYAGKDDRANVVHGANTIVSMPVITSSGQTMGSWS